MSANLNEELGQGRRFIIAPDYLVSDSRGENKKTVILSDYTYWTNQYDNLIQWCKDNGGILEGMILTFNDDNQLLNFVLRWS